MHGTQVGAVGGGAARRAKQAVETCKTNIVNQILYKFITLTFPAAWAERQSVAGAGPGCVGKPIFRARLGPVGGSFGPGTPRRRRHHCPGL